MRQIIYLSVFIFILLPNYSQTNNANSLFSERFLVVIDAGHGGKDSGALGSLSQEKDIALQLALRLGNFLEGYLPNTKVLYTRNQDVFIPLYQRTEFANRHHADLFFSIHCNSAVTNTAKVNGTETYVMGLHRAEDNLDAAKRENEAVLLEEDYVQNYGGYNPNSDESHIILSMYQNAYIAQSLLLAQKIEQQFETKVKRKSRGVKQAGFAVLRTATMPSVLVEAGFLTHQTEEGFLRSEAGQIYLASAMFRAIKSYRQTVETTAAAKWKAELGTTTTHKKTDTLAHQVPANNQVVYKVQLASSLERIPISTGIWKSVSDVECVQSDSTYKYMIGEHRTITMAAKRQSYWRSKGFKEAFVVAYRNGQKISLTEAVRINGR